MKKDSIDLIEKIMFQRDITIEDLIKSKKVNDDESHRESVFDGVIDSIMENV